MTTITDAVLAARAATQEQLPSVLRDMAARLEADPGCADAHIRITEHGFKIVLEHYVPDPKCQPDQEPEIDMLDVTKLGFRLAIMWLKHNGQDVNFLEEVAAGLG